MRGFLAFLLFSMVSAKREECTARCDRLHERSMKRIGFDEEKTMQLMEKQRPIGTMRDVCWRLYDRLDCQKRCPQDKEREKFARDVRFKCKVVLNDLAKDLKCVSRYRSFIQVKCSTFLKEAVALRRAQPPDSVPGRETCRYLHLNSLCLENSVGNYCASAKKIFRRLNFRDYFLNFIVPEDDFLFDDVDLDSCQIYDFVKTAKKISENEMEEELTTIINKWEEEEKKEKKWVTPSIPSHSTTTQRQEFTTLLDDLLASSSSEYTDEIPETTRVPSRKETEIDRESSSTTPLHRVFPSETTKSEESSIETTTMKRMETTSEGEYLGDGQDGGRLEETTPIEEFSLRLTPPTMMTSTTTRTTTTTTTAEDAVENEEKEENLQGTGHSTKVFRRLFSEDSMEETPPNFFWSSARFSIQPEYSSTVSSKRDPIVEPVEVDTSTLFGEDDFSTEKQKEKEEDEMILETSTMSTTTIETTLEKNVEKATGQLTEEEDPVAVPTIPSGLENNEKTENNMEKTVVKYKPMEEKKRKPLPTKKMKTTTGAPLLHGGVIVKTIRKYGETESEEEQSEKMQRSPFVDEDELEKFMGKEEENELWPLEEDVSQTTILPEDRLSDKEVLLFIYLLLFAMALLSLICVLICCICCRKKNNNDINKY